MIEHFDTIVLVTSTLHHITFGEILHFLNSKAQKVVNSTTVENEDKITRTVFVLPRFRLKKSSLVAVVELQVNFYSHLQKFFKTHQRDGNVKEFYSTFFLLKTSNF